MERDWLKRWSHYACNDVALVDVDSQTSYTYGVLFERSKKLAAYFKNVLRVTSGARVALLAKNSVQHIEIFFALQRIGAIFVPLNFRLAPREVDVILQDCKPECLIVSEEFKSVASELTQQTKLKQVSLEGLFPFALANQYVDVGDAFEHNDTNLLLYTSGTTGKPKGVIISHDMIFWNSINTGLALDLTRNDVTLHFHPFFHTSGWNVLLTPFLHRGAKIFFMQKFDAEKTLELCQTEKISILFGVPTMMDMMSRLPSFENTDFSSVRFAIVGGEPMAQSSIECWQNRGVAIRQGFGLTEFGPNVFSLHQKDAIRKKGSIGFPNFYVEVRVVDGEGNNVGVDEIGELLLKGPACTPGYWNNPEITKQTLCDGWLHTGDLVRFDEEGYFYVVGRKKDMFISGGENVYPAEVENFLRTHPSIEEAAVIGVPDSKWGEVGCAFVVTKPGFVLTEESVLKHCYGNLARYKIPKFVRFLSVLPKGDSGKVLKRQLEFRNQ